MKKFLLEKYLKQYINDYVEDGTFAINEFDTSNSLIEASAMLKGERKNLSVSIGYKKTKNGIKIISIESNREWINIILDQYSDFWHVEIELPSAVMMLI